MAPTNGDSSRRTEKILWVIWYFLPLLLDHTPDPAGMILAWIWLIVLPLFIHRILI